MHRWKRLLALLKSQWKTYIMLFFFISIVSFPCILFLGHYVWWRGLLLSLDCGFFFVASGVMLDYYSKKSI